MYLLQVGSNHVVQVTPYLHNRQIIRLSPQFVVDKLIMY